MTDTARPDALAADEHPITIDQVLALVDELANVSTPNPASGIVRLGLVTELRAELRPSLGSTGTGRGGAGKMPIDATALALWEDVTTRIQALPVDLGDDPATKGSLEQILNTWSRGLTAADAETRRIQRYRGLTETGLSADALLTMHRRLERIRDLIDNHFSPPRRIEYPRCPECLETHVMVDDPDGAHDDTIVQRALTLTLWPQDPDRPPIAYCTHCGATWTGYDSLDTLNNAVRVLNAEMDHAAYERSI
jgi:hypothetical protein